MNKFIAPLINVTLKTTTANALEAELTDRNGNRFLVSPDDIDFDTETIRQLTKSDLFHIGMKLGRFLGHSESGST